MLKSALYQNVHMIKNEEVKRKQVLHIFIGFLYSFNSIKLEKKVINRDRTNSDNGKPIENKKTRRLGYPKIFPEDSFGNNICTKGATVAIIVPTVSKTTVALILNLLNL